MLNKLAIENFKSLKHLEYECAGLNLLTGLNGAGKSSFIQCLRLMQKGAKAFGSPHGEFSVREFGSGFTHEDLSYAYAEGSPTSLGVEFSLVTGPSRMYSIKRLVETGGMQQPGVLSFEREDWEQEIQNCHREADLLKYLEWIDNQPPLEYSDQVFAAERKADEDFRNAERRMSESDREVAEAFGELWKGFRFVDAFRRKPTDVHAGGNYSAAIVLFGLMDQEPFDAEGQDVAEYLHKGDRGLLSKVNECLQWVSPGAVLSIGMQAVGDEEFYTESVGYAAKGDMHHFKPQNVGFGISYILPVLVTLLSAKPGSILVVENPEAHLHPRGQSEMGKLIAQTVARGVQVFVETHSDHVINGIRVAVKKGIVKPADVNVAFFERFPHDIVQKDGSSRREIYAEVRNIKIDEDGSLSEYPQGFMDEWGIQQMKLLRR